MKTLSNHPSKENYLFNPASNVHIANANVAQAGRQPRKERLLGQNQQSPDVINSQHDVLTPKALYQMSLGMLPDLWTVCHDLYHTFFEKNVANTAMQFVPTLKNMISIHAMEIERFIKNPETNHVLIQNDLLKVVLIHWKPGKYSSIHGHPVGGCVFKVLHGTIEEKRYVSDLEPDLLAVSRYEKGSMAYIDDTMAYHAVGNPFHKSAISLHAYTPGIKNEKL